MARQSNKTNKKKSIMKNKKLKQKKFVNFRFITFVLIFAIIAGVLIYKSFAATTVGILEAESMTTASTQNKIVSKVNASGGSALKLVDGTPASGSLNITGTADRIILRAKYAAKCGTAPQVRVQINGQSILLASVTTNTWKNYGSISVNLAKGTHDVTAYMTNPEKVNKCTRAVLLDYISAVNESGIVVTPPPEDPPMCEIDPANFDCPSKDDPDNYRQKVDFNVVCIAGTSSPIARIAKDDPIVFPGQPGAAHMHTFVGNKSVDAYSTQESLESGGTFCRLDRDTATYWMPMLYTDGKEVLPYHARIYYRAGSLNPVAHIPRGLKIIAGDAKATAPQDRKIAGWQCRSVSPDIQTVKKQSTIPDCPSTDLLEASVVFPNCWDGKNLDSTDHKSHMSYSWDDGKPDDCDSAHPVQIPQVTIAYRYKPGTTNSSSYLSAGNSGLTLHADFWNAWHQPTLDVLVDKCINDGVHCGDVSASHFPGTIPPL